MTFMPRTCLLIILAIAGISPVTKGTDVIGSNSLEICTSVCTNVISANLPAVILFQVRNVSLEPVQVLRPCWGSMDVVDEAKASVVASITDPSGGREQVRYVKPYIGPLKEIESVQINPITLAPSGSLDVQLIIGGAWRKGQEHPIFTQEGQYSVSLTYYPFVVTNKDGRLQVDHARAIQLPAFSILVSQRDSEDATTWEQIEKLKHWWILYDPEMRNVEYLSDAEQQELGNALAKLARDHGKSSYRKYLEYGAVALQAVRAKKGGVVPSDAVVKLDNLANDRGFAYCLYAQEIRNRVKLPTPE